MKLWSSQILQFFQKTLTPINVTDNIPFVNGHMCISSVENRLMLEIGYILHN